MSIFSWFGEWLKQHPEKEQFMKFWDDLYADNKKFTENNICIHTHKETAWQLYQIQKRLDKIEDDLEQAGIR